eukprot:2648083-Pyramimonas_sp.AAC.1
MSLDGSEDAPRRSKTAPRGQLSPRGGPPRSQNPSKTAGKQIIVGFSPFRFRWPSEASTRLQEGPRGPQEGPKRAPRRHQERPSALQERPKR